MRIWPLALALANPRRINSLVAAGPESVSLIRFGARGPAVARKLLMRCARALRHNYIGEVRVPMI